MLERLYSILERSSDPSSLSALFGGEISTTALILLGVVPICIALFIRELVCWFYKVNGFLRRLNRIETQLKRVADVLELNALQNGSTPKESSPIEPPLKPSAKIDVELKRRDF
jgi:hypothetical protein